MQRTRLGLIVSLCLISTSCGAPDAVASSAMFDAAFALVEEREFRSDYTLAPPLRGVTVRFDDEGSALVVDQAGSSVRWFDRAGEQRAVVFDRPSERETTWGPLWAYDTGHSVLVGEMPGDWMLRIDPDGIVVDTLWSTAGFVWWIDQVEAGTLVGERDQDSAYVFLRPALNEDRARTLYSRPTASQDAPYVGSITTESVAKLAGSVLVAASVEYPIWSIDIETGERSPFGTPPPSWRQAPRLTPEELSVDRQRRLNDWVSSFTIIAGVHVLEGDIVVVEHGELGRYSGGTDRVLTPTSTAIDVYDQTGTKIFEDLPLHGDIVGADHMLSVATIRGGRLVVQRYAPSWK